MKQQKQNKPFQPTSKRKFMSKESWKALILIYTSPEKSFKNWMFSKIYINIWIKL